MSYQYNLNQSQQYPVSYGTDASQIAGYVVATSNNTNDESGITDGLGIMSVFTAGVNGRKVVKYAQNTGSKVTDVLKESVAQTKTDAEALKKALSAKDKVKAMTKLSNVNKASQEIFDLTASLPSPKKLAKMSEETQKLYANASKALEKASTVKMAATKEKYIQQAKAFIEQASGKTTSTVATTAAKTTAKAATKTAAATTAAKTGSKLVKAIKGNALFIAIEGGVELFTKVVPTFKELGTKSGVKQLAKSGVKVAASVGGWQAGAALGAAIGSVIPGAGTAVGAVVGSVIGLASSVICSALATKVATAVVGKDELDKAEEQKQQQAQSSQTTATASNQQLLQQAGVQTQSQTQTQAKAQQSYQVNPFYNSATLSAYTTQDNADNILMMPLRAGLQFNA